MVSSIATIDAVLEVIEVLLIVHLLWCIREDEMALCTLDVFRICMPAWV